MRKLLFALLTAAAAGTATPAFACSCIDPASVDVPEFVARTPVLVWGRALSVRREGRHRIYVFEVAGAKGALPSRVEVRTAASSAACGATFPMNQTALIAGSVRDGAIIVGSCGQYVVRARRAEIEAILARCKPFQPCP